MSTAETFTSLAITQASTVNNAITDYNFSMIIPAMMNDGYLILIDFPSTIQPQGDS